MTYWAGVIGCAAGGWMFYLAHKHRKRAEALAAARASAADGPQELAPMHASLESLAEVAAPLMVFFVFVAGAMLTLAFFVIRSQTEITLAVFDLAGVWAALLGYGRYLSWKSKYRTGGSVRAASAAEDAGPGGV